MVNNPLYITNKIIDDYFSELDEVHNINGVVSIEQEDNIIFRKAFGYANLEFKIPNTIETKFLIGSNTKLFTAVAIMQLIEKNIISLDTTIDVFFPENVQYLKKKVTIHNLLSQTGGIKDFSDLDTFKDYKVIDIDQNILLEAIFRESEELPTDEYKYSNPGYYILGIIIEKLTGFSYKNYITKNIFVPLHMMDSSVYYQDDIIEYLATGYKKYETLMTTSRYFEMKKWSAAAGIYSTLNDINKWLIGLSCNKILTSKSFKKICSPVKKNYGYGCLIPETKNIPYIWHNGFIKGQYSYIRFYPSKNIRMQILRNSSAFTSETADEINTDDVCSTIAEMIGV